MGLRLYDQRTSREEEVGAVGAGAANQLSMILLQLFVCANRRFWKL